MTGWLARLSFVQRSFPDGASSSPWRWDSASSDSSYGSFSAAWPSKGLRATGLVAVVPFDPLVHL